MKLILPKTLVPQSEITNPLFFLAGPIKGGDDWQQNCCGLIQKHLGNNFTVVVPCRWKEDHPLYRYKVKGQENVFTRQTVWERHYLDLASNTGALSFGFLAKAKRIPGMMAVLMHVTRMVSSVNGGGEERLELRIKGYLPSS